MIERLMKKTSVSEGIRQLRTSAMLKFASDVDVSRRIVGLKFTVRPSRQ